MKPVLIAIASIALAATIAGASGGAQQDAERQLKTAMNTELVDGNLKLAIEQYKKVVDSGNRALAAQALLRMADCYQKLGDREAQAIYDRVVRDYSDQKDAAAIARARLGPAAAVVRTKSDRPIWTGVDTDGFGTISQDGRYLTYTDWRNGARLILRDLETGSDRLLTDSAQGGTQFSVISKNSKEVVYEWFARDGNAPPELRIMSLSPSSAAPRRLTFAEDVSGIAAFDWSADGEWLAVQVGRKDRTKQIGIVKVQDGSLRVLKSIDWKNTIKIFFSPDSRYLAYDLPVNETTNHRHVFVMAIDGTREMAAVAHASNNVIMGWSPDGRQLLFSSDRGGTTGLWALAIADGKAMRAPALVRPDIAASWSLGVTAAGSMFVWKDRRGLSVRTAGLDLTRGTLLTDTKDTPEQFIRSRGRPAWSHDGKHLAYQSCTGLGGGPCSVLTWSLETGKVTELPTTIKYQQGFNWSPDGRFLITPGVDFRGRRGIYRIDAQTGESSPVVMAEAVSPQWSADGRSIYYRARDARGTLVVKQHDLASGAEREILRTPADTAGFLVSSDERSVAYSGREGSARTVQVIPFSGGQSRAVLEVTAPDEIYPLSWTPDDRALLVLKMRDGQTTELWLAPVTGERPRKIEGDISQWTADGSIRLSPDGTRIAFVHAAGAPGYEIWAIENFLPVSSTARPSAKK